MATPTTIILLLTIILSISTITTTARPCKTIFFITSTTTTTTSYYPNPNPTRLTFFITEIHHFHPTKPYPNNDVVSSKPSSPSILSRTLDILSVIGALLFGVGCGAITAGTIYLVCSLFSNNPTLYFDSDDSDLDDVTPNHNGYVPVASKEVPPSADEVDAMK